MSKTSDDSLLAPRDLGFHMLSYKKKNLYSLIIMLSSKEGGGGSKILIQNHYDRLDSPTIQN